MEEKEEEEVLEEEEEVNEEYGNVGMNSTNERTEGNE